MSRKKGDGGNSPFTFWLRVDFATYAPCWIWTGAKSNTGYGHLTVENVSWLAHRYAYTDLIGGIPDDLTLDHLCVTRLRVNPQHLEPVTLSENIRRMNARIKECV